MSEHARRGEPDILEVIANLSSNEVFTPPRVANDVLDLLPPEVWTDPTLRWLDPGAKTGVFPREITRRLMVGLRTRLPDEQERLGHILKHMVYALAITDLTAMMTRRSLYCSRDAASTFSTVPMRSSAGNVWYKRTKHGYDANGRCNECGGTRERLEQPGRDNFAYGFIHASARSAIAREFPMKFDVIVGNPPYQIEDDGHGRSASPLYHEFVQQAIALDPSFVLMVVPSRWMGGGKGLDDFRKSMLGDRRMNVLVDFQDSRSVFPSVDIAGGICYFLWQRDHDGPCRVVSDGPEGRTEELRDLSEFDVVIRGQRALQIVRKVRARASSYMSAMVSARKPFGLDTTARPRASGELILRWQNGEGPFPRSAVTAGAESIDRWKVVASYAGFDHAGAPDKDGRRRVLSVVTVLPPGTICNETYLVIGAFDTRAEAESLRSYMLTRFFRFLLSQRMFSQHLTRTVYSFVPQQTWDRAWTDEALYAAYGLDAEDQSHIEASIREMPA